MLTIRKHLFNLFILFLVSAILKFIGINLLESSTNPVLLLLSSLFILTVGAIFVLTKAAKIIEETTEVLSEKTKIAGGLLQSLGTAFPDMILGVTAALVSLRLQQNDMTRAINYAIIAASTTFGSNIYNIGHAAWCIFRQNLSDSLDKSTLMFPFIKSGGYLTPMKHHRRKPSIFEIDNAISLLVALTLLTLFVAVSMVIFGRVTTPPSGFQEDLYQLIKPAGFIVMISSFLILYIFRKSKRPINSTEEIIEEENFYRHKNILLIWTSLIVSGISILLAAESMVKAIETVCDITHLPFVIAGVFAGIIGCLGEMLVVHNFSVNSSGRIGDAIVGVAMDNIVTIAGASIVAVMGGIFLGGSSLILIFVIILSLNTVLIWQIANLKNIFIDTPNIH